MLKKSILAALLGWCLIATFDSHAASVKIIARYRPAADLFVLMDCTSGWWDFSFCRYSKEYQEEWKRRFGLSDEDKATFVKYDEFRRRYYRGLGQPKETFSHGDGLFPPRASMHEDLVAPAFYSSNTLDEALGKLKDVVASADLEFLKSFYQRFKTKYEQVLVESKPFVDRAKKLEKLLGDPRYAKFYSDLLSYYSVRESMEYEALYVWFPPLRQSFSWPVDRNLLLGRNPGKHPSADEDQEVAFHELVHAISVRQPQEQKEAISLKFLERCPGIDKSFRNRMTVLEEPITVALGQILFLETFQPKSLRWDEDFYNNPWINAFARTIFQPLRAEIKSGQHLSVATAERLGNLCKDFVAAASAVVPVKQ